MGSVAAVTIAVNCVTAGYVDFDNVKQPPIIPHLPTFSIPIALFTLTSPTLGQPLVSNPNPDPNSNPNSNPNPNPDPNQAPPTLAALQRAWKIRFVMTHPDRGGSAADAQAVTAARDALHASLFPREALEPDTSC